MGIRKKISIVAASVVLATTIYLIPLGLPSLSTQAHASHLAETNSVARHIVNSLTSEEKINQMIMVPAEYALTHPQENFGGVIYVGGIFTKYTTFAKLLEANNSLKRHPLQPLLAVDEEGGLVDRLKYVQDFESYCAPETKDFITKYFAHSIRPFALPSEEGIMQKYLLSDHKAEFMHDFKKYAHGIAETLDRAGFNLNLAPVADIVPDIDSISMPMAADDRTFGSDSIVAQQLLTRYIAGFNAYTNKITRSRIMATVKHFPGLGSAQTDPHTNEVIITKSLDELLSKDVAIYDAIIPDAPVIMLSQAIYPSLDATNPATASKRVREFLISRGFKGIILSDDVTMGALNIYEEQYHTERWKYLALACDMILTVQARGSGKQVDILDKIRTGIKNTLSFEEISDRVAKIVTYKLEYGLARENKWAQRDSNPRPIA